MHTTSLRFLAEPSDVNFGGKVHGGSVMKWIDQAGYACAAAWSGQYCVTVYVGGIRFYHPVRIGQLVEVTARLVHTGTSSMHIAVDVHAQDVRTGARNKTTHCIIVFVAVNDAGEPVGVRPWTPDSEEASALSAYAVRLMDLRKEIEQAMAPYRGLEGGNP